MLFNSVAFLVFAALFFPLYFAFRGRTRLWLILIASCVFYGWWDWRFLALLALSIVVDYTLGRLLGVARDARRRRMLVIGSVVVNLSILGFFKYFNFFADSLIALGQLFGAKPSWVTLNVLLPIGISFYTFQSLSYTIDVYRGMCPPERSLLRFACFVTLFPQLVAGPIVRAVHLLPQLSIDHSFSWNRTFSGLELIIWGFFLKLALADTIGHQLALDRSFEAPEQYGAAGHLVASTLFAFQIYGDFAGYSAIAIGLGRIMGYDLGVNFRRPYLSSSFSEFWQRWHISLSSWLRDYLYIPLGGNRQGTLLTYRNLLITMFLGGLWHGAAWTFVIWGLLHGAYLVIWRLGAEFLKSFARLTTPAEKRIARLPLILVVFLLTTLAWVFFRAPSLASASEISRRILTLDSSTTVVTTDRIGLAKCALVILIVIAVDIAVEFRIIHVAYARHPEWRAAAMAAVLWSIALLGTFSGSIFIYFQF
jgi:alginate O-acetyltransferase complex protein AlgI